MARELGVNIDHVATLRQQRGTAYPDPIKAAAAAVDAGADSITAHLREDRRHIQDHDIDGLIDALTVPLNLEMAATKEMLEIASRARPKFCCVVPERREELTTEGGLNLLSDIGFLRELCEQCKDLDIRVSLFIDPEIEQIDRAVDLNVPAIEIHTGQYAQATTKEASALELERIRAAARHASNAKLIVNAGHGLNLRNLRPLVAIRELEEFNIGHALGCRCFVPRV